MLQDMLNVSAFVIGLSYPFLIISFISEKLFRSNLLFFADVIKARSAKIKARRLNVSIIEGVIQGVSG